LRTLAFWFGFDGGIDSEVGDGVMGRGRSPVTASATLTAVAISDFISVLTAPKDYLMSLLAPPDGQVDPNSAAVDRLQDRCSGQVGHCSNQAAVTNLRDGGA
jgi:hypothetical protein